MKTKCQMVKLFLICLSLFGGNLFGQCLKSGEYLSSLGRVQSSIGNPQINEKIKIEVDYLEKFFGLDIDFFFLQEQAGSNAFFMPSCNRPQCDGTVVLGVNLLADKIVNDRGVVFKATLAHEFAHAVQHKLGHNGVYKRPELHADFIAGYYIGKTYNLTINDLATFIDEFASIGDYNFYDIGHHGTPYERACSFKEGFYYAKEQNGNLVDAYNFGWTYVEADNPCIVRSLKAYDEERRLQLNNFIFEQRKAQVNRENKINEHNEKIRRKEVGSLVFKVIDKKRYRIFTLNGIQEPIANCINCTSCKIGDRNGSYKWWLDKSNSINVGALPDTDKQPIVVFRKIWFLGNHYIKVGSYAVPILREKTTSVTINKGKIAYRVE